MDENLWRFAQVTMWLLGLQTTIILSVLGFMWAHFNRRFDKVDQRFEKVDQRFDKVDQRFEKIESTLNDIDKQVFAVETMLHMKDCCMLKDDRQTKKAE